MSKAESDRGGKVLGRGLSSLLKTTVADAPPAVPGMRILELPLDQISPGSLQTRTTFDQTALAELADSIRQVGVVQPVVVRRLPTGRYELISGERRWRASQLAGRTAIPALVRDDGDATVLQVSLIENVQRENLNPVERAKAYALFRDAFQVSAEEMAVRTGENRATVTNYLRLLELPVPVLALVEKGALTMGHARALLGLPNEASQMTHANLAVSKQLSVRELEKLVADTKAGQIHHHQAPARVRTAPHLEEQISSALGLPVSVRLGRERGKGTLSIRFASLDEFDRLMQLLNVRID